MPFRFLLCILLSLSTFPLSIARAADDSLSAYVALHDPSYAWKEQGRTTVLNVNVVELMLTSQTWHGTAWKHRLLVLLPQQIQNPKQALLLINGGSWRGDPKPGDGPQKIKLNPEAVALAAAIEQISCPVAILSHVPFQPMFDGKKEDALIAYTFDQFLKSADPNWPLLLPMVKSAVRSMDAVQEFVKQEQELDVDSFTVTGASKRGWTTWLTAAVDPRVTAAAPMVIDMLNMSQQAHHQIDVWGEFSGQIHDYTELDIPKRLESELGQVLQRIVDPYSYRERLTQPKLILLGSNDPYWPVDSSNFYWDGLNGEKFLTIVPNAGHDLGNDIPRVVSTLVAFHQHASGHRVMPKMSWRFTERDGEQVLTVNADQKPRQASVWIAESSNRDFREARWRQSPMVKTANGFEFAIRPEDGKCVALFGELAFEGAPPAYLSTNVRLIGGGE